MCLHIEDANFSEKEFVDLLPNCWESCFKLFEEVQEFDSKVNLLSNKFFLLDGKINLLDCLGKTNAGGGGGGTMGNPPSMVV